MSFNLGIANHPTSRLGGISSIGVYLYEDIYYRQWITEVALAFYEGRQDEFVWLDLQRQFRNPEKQQILPMNLTKEIIDEVSVLYQEPPIYQVVDSKGKLLKKDQELWEQIMDKSRYLMLMDKLDRWCRLLGTVLVKVSFVDPDTGKLVKENQGGQVQLDILHGGVYDIRHGASPYYITELLIGFGTKFGGWGGNTVGGSKYIGGALAGTVPSPANLGPVEAIGKGGLRYTAVSSPKALGKVNRIYWSPNDHVVVDNDNNGYEVKNPYGIIPAVPFFNADPAHYYFLPVNEPLIYANHALNMRITDLNHIVKFQSFGVPVVKGVERSTSLRQGRPVDDFNQLKGGAAQARFGGLGGLTGMGASGAYRSFDGGFGIFRDGNADANALGMSLGPDTAVAVGEKGDFKFAHPSADITGLVKTIHSITDMVRINHGLRPKYEQSLPSSGFSLLMEKIGVLEGNKRRARLFREREQQLFAIIKQLWNTHHAKSGDPKFSEDSELEVTYREPEFPVDPKTRKEDLIMEAKILESGNKHIIGKLYPHLSESEVEKLVEKVRKDMKEQMVYLAEVGTETAEMYTSKGLNPPDTSPIKEDKETSGVKVDNRAKHSENSSKQAGKNGDPRAEKKKKITDEE